MWPGANPPPGPPPGQGPQGPQGPVWAPEPRRIRPSAGWYALSAVLLLVAAVGFFAVFAFLVDDSNAADGPSASGSPATGVTIRLREGYGYFVYVRTGQAAPLTCSVRVDERSGPVRLTRKNAWSASDHPTYRYTASFEAPVSGTALLTCRGTGGPILVTPDDTANAYIGFAFFAGFGMGVLAIVVFVVTLVRRAASARRSAAVRGPSGY